MKKRVMMLLTGILASAAMLAGCSGSKGLETDALSISVYKGVEIPEVDKPVEATDEEVEGAIQTTLQMNATQEEITDRPVEEGDTATIDFTGKIDGQEFEGGSATDYPLTIGSGVFIEGFEDSVIGHSIGETYDWSGKFPDDYPSAEVAGKDVVFTITVKSIAKSSLPELSDNFVRSVSKKSENVEEYREEVKKQLDADNTENYEDQVNQAVWQKVLDNTEIKKYPEDEIKEISDSLIEQYKSMAEYVGKDYETYIKEQMGCSVEEFEKQVEDVAKSSLKQSMVTEAIASKEKIKIGDKEYEEQVKTIAAEYGYEDVEALKEVIEEEELKDIALNNMVRDWLKEHSVQVAKE
ncbi:MAG: trigger factor [Dorea sp.]|jgi:trigger factor|nr:trigger factor [Dorea sp.]